MVLMEKALSMQRQEISGETFSTLNELETSNTKNILFQAIDQVKMDSAGFMNDLGSRLTNAVGSMNTVLSRSMTVLELRKPESPRLVRGFELVEDTKLYEMEPYAGPETHVDLGIDLYDIESSWKN